jgi:hypothetical protein
MLYTQANQPIRFDESTWTWELLPVNGQTPTP